MKTVLADTNIILWTFNNGPDFRKAIADIAPNYDLAIPTCVLSELEKINTNQAKAALDICKSLKNVDIGDGYADNMLILAAKKGYLIATNDKEILNTLSDLKLNALKIRKGKKLIYTEGAKYD